MHHNRVSIILIVVSGLCSAFLAITTNWATDSTPGFLQTRPWLTWVLFGFFAITGIVITIKVFLATSQDQGIIDTDIDMEYVTIPRGEFLMGSSQDEIDGLIQHYGDEVSNHFQREVLKHRIQISQPFNLSIYPVTQAQWETVMGKNPSELKDDPNLPVVKVSWDEVQEFIRLLNEGEAGANYRLPTEAEWEYACRASSTTAYCFGDDPDQLTEYAWYRANSDDRIHPVGQLKPNAWGLYDMHGNVWEWVQDWYGAYLSNPDTDPTGPRSGSNRVIRGGCCRRNAGYSRSAFRSQYDPSHRGPLLGFRLVKSLP